MAAAVCCSAWVDDACLSVEHLIRHRHEPELFLEALIEVWPGALTNTTQPAHAQLRQSAVVGEAVEVRSPSAKIPATRQARHPEAVTSDATGALFGGDAGAVPAAVVLESRREEPSGSHGGRQLVVDV